jgi:hypothetical protein
MLDIQESLLLPSAASRTSAASSAIDLVMNTRAMIQT